MLKKYLKYKNKYLHLKNQTGGFTNYVYYYFNDDLETNYLYEADPTNNTYEAFLDSIVKSRDGVEIYLWTKEGRINIKNDNQFKRIRDGKIINIITDDFNIKEELLAYSFDAEMQPIESIPGPRRTLSSSTREQIKQTQKKNAIIFNR